MRAALLLVLVACGRIGFDSRGGALADANRDAAGDDGNGDDASGDGTVDALTSPIVHVGPFAQRNAGAGTQDSFTANAMFAGDVIAISVTCATAGLDPSSVIVDAAGWQFSALDTPTGASPYFSSQLVAIAPNTTPATVTVTWAGTNCELGKTELADEFANVYTAGGVGGVYSAGNKYAGTGNCATSFTTVIPAETVWAACLSTGGVTAVPTGYTRGADNGAGDWSAFRITTDAAGAQQQPSFPASGAFLIDVIELRPR